MPKIVNDERDTVKRTLGKEIRRMRKEEPEKLAVFLSSLSNQEAEDILYDAEIFARDNQYIRLDSKVPIHFMSLGRGAGKLLCDKTPMLTHNRGWTTVGDVVVGDFLFDEGGKPTKVLGVFPGEREEACKFTFSDGSEVTSSLDHLWVTWQHRDRKQYLRLPENKNSSKMPENWPNWSHPSRHSDAEDYGPSERTTREIIDSFTHSSRGDKNHSIPLCKPLDISHKPVLVDPYLYGYWIGDGTTGHNWFTVGEEDREAFLSEVAKTGYEVGNNNGVISVSLLGFTKDLRTLETLTNKVIHPEYLMNSKDVRLAFLQGLMDSDGHMDTGRGTVEFCSKRSDHAEAVLFLARSLGYRPVLAEGRAMLNGVDYGTKYRVTWNPKPDNNPFRLDRKAKYVKSPLTQGFRNCHRMIKSYEMVSGGPMTCFSVDSANNLFLAGEALIPTHNTYTGATTVKRGVEKHGLKFITIIAATSRDIRSTIVPAIEACYPPDHENRPFFSPAKSQVLWPNGAIAVCISAESGEDAIRGLNNEFIWGDESAFWGNNEGIIDQALLTLRLEPSIMLITTTPKATPKMVELYERGGDPEDKMVLMYTGSTYENMENLSDVFIDTVISKYEGTRMGETELQGRLILTNDSALWQHNTVEDNTVQPHEVPKLVEICIGVDPAVLAKKTSAKGRTPDQTGIIVSGIDANDVIYTLDGATGSYTTEGWTTKVATLYDKYSNLYPTSIAIEINVLGEEMIKMAFDKNGRRDVSRRIKPVFATQSKLQRAAPYSLMAEQGQIKYVDRPYLKALKMELTTFDGTGKSPNNWDAAVWSWNHLQPVRKSFTKSIEFLI